MHRPDSLPVGSSHAGAADERLGPSSNERVAEWLRRGDRLQEETYVKKRIAVTLTGRQQCPNPTGRGRARVKSGDSAAAGLADWWEDGHSAVGRGRDAHVLHHHRGSVAAMAPEAYDREAGRHEPITDAP